MSKPKDGCVASMSKEDKETFYIQWKYITKKLKTSGYDLSGVKITKGNYQYG